MKPEHLYQGISPATQAGYEQWLVDLHDAHPDFRSRHEMPAPGMADYLPAAMRHWARAAEAISG